MSVGSGPPASPPRVCYLTKRFPRLSETFILDEVLGLEASGVPLRLFAIADPGEEDVQPDVARVNSTVTYLRTGGRWVTTARDYARFVRGHAVLFGRRPRQWTGAAVQMLTSGRIRPLAKHFLEAGGMATAMDRVDGDHLHAAFAHGPASVAHYVHLLTGRPFSFAAHAKDLYLSSPHLLAEKVAASTFVLACSENAADELHRIVASHPDPNVNVHTAKVILAPHGVDIGRFRPGRPAVRTEPGTLRILAVGRLVPKKGHSTLLAALASLKASGVKFRCRIVGGGALRDELSRLVTRLGLEDQVTMCGTRTQQEIIEEYHRSDVFVQASVITADGDRDGIPNSVLEAMASGLAVVASSVAGLPEVIRNGETGLLIAPGQSDPLARALRSLADDPTLRDQLGSAARRFVVEHLSRSSCIEPVAYLLLGSIPVASAHGGAVA